MLREFKDPLFLVWSGIRTQKAWRCFRLSLLVVQASNVRMQPDQFLRKIDPSSVSKTIVVDLGVRTHQEVQVTNPAVFRQFASWVCSCSASLNAQATVKEAQQEIATKKP